MKDSPISPFPADIDRDSFGHWLSGFVDGDGALCLWMRRYSDCRAVTPQASLTIKLRADDAPILRLIQSYFGCGAIGFHSGVMRTYETKPSCSYTLKSPADLTRVVVPHFEKFPLRTKKRRDFCFWKEAVLLAHTVSLRPRRGRRGLGGAGTLSPWLGKETEQFVDLMSHLRSIRAYQANAHLPPVPIPKNERVAFSSWLSGFVDAEGCFAMWLRSVPDQVLPRADVSFQINLRDDDRPILLQIKSFWGCGDLTPSPKRGRNMPQALFRVTNPEHLMGIIVPHFEAFPLRAKKAKDLLTWKEAVALRHTVALRRIGEHRRRRGGKGVSPWLPEERIRFQRLIEHLRTQRAYNSTPSPIPETPREPTLFDSLED